MEANRKTGGWDPVTQTGFVALFGDTSKKQRTISLDNYFIHFS
jgi:hypothetical protein